MEFVEKRRPGGLGILLLWLQSLSDLLGLPWCPKCGTRGQRPCKQNTNSDNAGYKLSGKDYCKVMSEWA